MALWGRSEAALPGRASHWGHPRVPIGPGVFKLQACCDLESSTQMSFLFTKGSRMVLVLCLYDEFWKVRPHCAIPLLVALWGRTPLPFSQVYFFVFGTHILLIYGSIVPLDTKESSLLAFKRV